MSNQIFDLHSPGVMLQDQIRDSLADGPGILITNPGSLQDEREHALMSRILHASESAIFLPVRPDTPLDLRVILSGMHGRFQTVSYFWPAHPTEEEMVEQLISLMPQAILLVHGSQEMQRNLRASLPAAIIRRSISSGETLRVRPQGA